MNLILSIIIASHLLTVVPQKSFDYVSTADDTVTRSAWASAYGAFGFLAHNHLAGRYIDDLELGDIIMVTSADGAHEFEVVEIKQYRVDGDYYIDLETEERLTNQGVIDEVYRAGHVYLQTCIAWGNNPSWGRLFVIAKEVSD
jgi:hypothetical protein